MPLAEANDYEVEPNILASTRH